MLLDTRSLFLRGPSNTTAFIGDFWQIMEHDIGPAPSGFFTGVKLADPDEDISTRLKRWYLIYRIETDARGLDRCWKRGTPGQISWNTHEYHPFIRSLAVWDSAFQYFQRPSLENIAKTCLWWQSIVGEKVSERFRCFRSTLTIFISQRPHFRVACACAFLWVIVLYPR